MEKQKTLTARQLIRNYKLDTDRVFSIINQHGMDPLKLYGDDVTEIRKAVSGRKSHKNSLLEEAVVPMPQIEDEKLIIMLRNQKEGTVRYMFAKDLTNIHRDSTSDEVPFRQFIEDIEADTQFTTYEPRSKPVKNNPPYKNPNDGEGENSAPEKTRKRSDQVTIEKKLATYLLNRRDELGLRSLIFGEPREEPVNLTHSTALLKEIFSEELIDTLKAHSYEIKAFSPEALIKIAQKEKTKRIRRDIAEYFEAEKGQFINANPPRGFDLEWGNDDDITKVVKWVKSNSDDSSKDMPFYISCINVKLGDKLSKKYGAKRKEMLMQAWLWAATHYEFTRGHTYTRKLVAGNIEPETFDDLAFRIVNDFAGNKSYKEGDARRFLGGLFVSGKAVPSKYETAPTSNFQNAERAGNDVDYLLTRYSDINDLSIKVLERIKNGDLREDPNRFSQRLYESIKTGTFKIQGKKEANQLGRVLRAQLNEKERAYFHNRGRKDRNTKLSDQSVDKILGWYVLAEKDEIMKAIN